MAKVTIAGDAVIITSSMKLEDLRTIAKYRPDALTLKGGDSGNEPMFALSVANGGHGSINQYGASFTTESHDGEKLATITLLDVVGGDDIRDAVAERIGTSIINLNKLEKTLPDVLREIADEKSEILNNIRIAQ